MMGYALSGWNEIVIEVRWILEEPEQLGEFIVGVNGIFGATLLPPNQGSPLLGAMIEGQGENAHWVRIEGPPMVIQAALSQLTALCTRVFTRVHGNPGEPT